MFLNLFLPFLKGLVSFLSLMIIYHLLGSRSLAIYGLTFQLMKSHFFNLNCLTFWFHMIHLVILKRDLVSDVSKSPNVSCDPNKMEAFLRQFAPIVHCKEYHMVDAIACPSIRHFTSLVIAVSIVTITIVSFLFQTLYAYCSLFGIIALYYGRTPFGT